MHEQAIIEQSYRAALRDYQSQRLEQAKELADRILLLQPDHADTVHLLGMIAHTEARPDQSLNLLRQAIALSPHDATCHASLGLVLSGSGQFLAAIESYLTAIHLDPDFADAYYNLGIAYRCINQTDKSIAAYQKALALRPTFPQALNDYAHILRQNGRMEEAIDICRQTLEIKPNHIEARNNLGVILKDLGRVEEAITCLDQAIAIDPQCHVLHSNRLFSLYYKESGNPAYVHAEHVQWAKIIAEPLIVAHRAHENDPFPDRKLKIGYVSPDFREHCQSLFTLPLLAHHDHDRFDIHCYSNAAESDEMTERLKGHADHWRMVAGVSDADAAGMVRQDGIDLLVDLTLHMGRNRLLLFAQKPAPLQVTWLGYPGTTGLSAIDYRLTDPYLDPPGRADGFYVERSHRLPETFWCFDPQSELETNDLPAEQNGFITFGCLNNFCKVNDGILKLWREVLLGIANARLVLLAPRGAARDHVLETLRVEPSRITFTDFQPRSAYLKTYHEIDICLDTFPYNGHTTSLDALWMGVPVVSLCGEIAVSRAGWSQASNCGLRELVAQDPIEFVRIAKDLANNLPHLRALRASLRNRMIQSPLMDAPRFVRSIEQAYRSMWQNWCRNLPA